MIDPTEPGRVTAPITAQNEDGTIIGDSIITISPDDPDYEQYLRAQQKREQFYQKYPHLRPGTANMER